MIQIETKNKAESVHAAWKVVLPHFTLESSSGHTSGMGSHGLEIFVEETKKKRKQKRRRGKVEGTTYREGVAGCSCIWCRMFISGTEV